MRITYQTVKSKIDAQTAMEKDFIRFQPMNSFIMQPHMSVLAVMEVANILTGTAHSKMKYKKIGYCPKGSNRFFK